MAKIYIEPSKVRATLSQQQALERTLRKLSQDVRNVRSGLRYKISGREAIDARLREAMKQIDREIESTKAMHRGLEQIVISYEQTEQSNMDCVKAEKTSIQHMGEHVSVPSAEGDIRPTLKDWLEKLKDIIPWYLQPFLPGVMWPLGSIVNLISRSTSSFEIKYGADVDRKDTSENSFFSDKIDKFEEDHTTTLEGKKVYWDPKNGTVLVDDNDEGAKEAFDKHNKGTIPVDVTLCAVGVSNTTSLWNQKGSFSGKYGGAESEVSVGKIEGSAEGHVGSGYVGASVGATVTGLSASEKAYLGSKDYNVYEEVKVEAGRMGVKGDVRVGLVDKEGKVNPSLYTGVSAEAIAGEVSGKVGVKVGGVDVAAEGSLNYGLGAHVNAGYHDGKLSFDIGATVGVGVSVKLDIDVSGAVNTFCEKADKVWSGVKNLFKH